MKRLLRKFRNRLRRNWYRRHYYLSRFWPRRVPFNPLPWLPDGFTVHTVGETGIRVVENFVTHEEADYLIETARRKLARSTVVVDGKPVIETGRTSSHAVLFHRYAQDPRVLPIIARGAMLAGVPIEHAEQVYVSRYGPGEFYHGHYDVAGDFLTRDRLCTMLVYLNELAEHEGGATYFRDLNVAVRPRKGCAVCWTNTNPDGSVHEETLHAALPPEGDRVEKWVIQLWFRPYRMFPVPHRLEPLQQKPGVPLQGDEPLPDGVWVPSRESAGRTAAVQ